jgi:alpha-L-fucosidase
MKKSLLLLATHIALVFGYDPNWASLDNRTLPQWYDDAKIGIFIVGAYKVHIPPSTHTHTQTHPQIPTHTHTTRTVGGVFSVPSWGANSGGASGEWFQCEWEIERKPDYVNYMAANYPPSFTYADFAPALKYDLFNATQWAELFLRAGARYTVFLTKHHDG